MLRDEEAPHITNTNQPVVAKVFTIKKNPYEILQGWLILCNNFQSKAIMLLGLLHPKLDAQDNGDPEVLVILKIFFEELINNQLPLKELWINTLIQLIA